MEEVDLLIECKKGLGIPILTTNFDGPLTQKIATVKMYMSGAGVSETILKNDLAVGAIVMGVIDIWNIEGGNVKFSPLFNTFLIHLSIKSGVI